MLRMVAGESTGEELSSTLDEICREGARRMLAAALELEAGEYIAAVQGLMDDAGRRLVVRNGHARPRAITTAAGSMEIRASRVNDRRVDPDTGERQRFKSSIVPPWCRKSPKVSEVLPLLYLHGLSTGDFAPALGEFFGSAAGLSPSVITRLTTQWQTSTGRSWVAPSPTGTTCTSGSTGSTSTSARTTPACVAWSSWVSASTAPRSWSPSLTATGSPPTAGPTCYATSNGGEGEPR